MAVNKHLSIKHLNVNGLNAPIKRHRIAQWITKHDPHMCCLQETHLKTKELHRLKLKGVDPKTMLYLHNGILHSREKEGASTLCNSMDGTGEHYAK